MTKEQEERFNQGEVIATTTSGTEIRIALRNIPGLKGWINELLEETTSKLKEELLKMKYENLAEVVKNVGDTTALKIFAGKNQALQEVLSLIETKETKG